MNSLISYFALAYVSQTVSKVASSLIPVKSHVLKRLIQEWSATGTGITLAVASQVDILGDIGLDVGMEPLGFAITGLILGHGVQYTMNFFNNGPWNKSGQKPAA